MTTTLLIVTCGLAAGIGGFIGALGGRFTRLLLIVGLRHGWNGLWRALGQARTAWSKTP